MSSDKVPGSFFNPVPDKEERSSSSPSSRQKKNTDDSIGDDNIGDTNNEDKDDSWDFDRNISKILQKRRAKPRALTPSTLGGVPTSKAKGFGKTPPPSKKPFIGIGPPDTKPLNDINNPEYDDQGFTLYTNEQTGEKSRVFEALVDYPTVFKIKIVGANEGTFVSDIVALVAENCGVEEIKFTERRNGKWVSVTVHAPVENAEMLYVLYENIDRDPRVKFKF